MIKKHQPLRRFPDYKSSIVRSPDNKPLLINFSNSEITGPLFNKNILNENDNNLILNFSKNGEKALGQEIFVHGFVKDENGNPLKDVLKRSEWHDQYPELQLGEQTLNYQK